MAVVGGPLAHVVLWSTCYLLKVDRDGEDETASLWLDFSAGVGFVAWLKQVWTRTQTISIRVFEYMKEAAKTTNNC